MKKSLILAMAFLSFVFAPALTYANDLDNPGLAADCDTFTITATASTRVGCTGTVQYTLVLTPQNSPAAPITINGGFAVPDNPEGFTISHTGEFGALPCGEYAVEGSLELWCDTVLKDRVILPSTTLICGCTGSFDPRTPGYWKNHPEMWPVATLMIGEVLYDQARLLEILDTPVRGDARIILMKHLIAAKLNVLSGADAGIQSIIDAADACLINNCNKRTLILIKDQLDIFNNSNN